MKKKLIPVLLLTLIVLSACKKDVEVATSIPSNSAVPNLNSRVNGISDGLNYTGFSDAGLQILKQRLIDDPNLLKLTRGITSLDDILFASGYENGVNDAKAYMNSMNALLDETHEQQTKSCNIYLSYKVTSVYSVGLEKNVKEGYVLQDGESKSGIGLVSGCVPYSGWWYLRKRLKEADDSGGYIKQINFNAAYPGRTSNQISYDQGVLEGFMYSINSDPIGPF